LDEGFDLGEDSIKIEIPLVLFVVFGNNGSGNFVYFAPLLSAVNTVLQILHAFLHITIQHVFYVYLLFATFYYLV
jgi:hypothetical protein